MIHANWEVLQLKRKRKDLKGAILFAPYPIFTILCSYLGWHFSGYRMIIFQFWYQVKCCGLGYSCYHHDCTYHQTFETDETKQPLLSLKGGSDNGLYLHFFWNPIYPCRSLVCLWKRLPSSFPMEKYAAKREG